MKMVLAMLSPGTQALLNLIGFSIIFMLVLAFVVPVSWLMIRQSLQSNHRVDLRRVVERLQADPRRLTLEAEIANWTRHRFAVRVLSDQHVRLETPFTLGMNNWWLEVWLERDEIVRMETRTPTNSDWPPPGAPADWIPPA